MRYAWNLSHGNGLVWNKGEYVQGYTNLLMTLLMSVTTYIFSKSVAVLAIQIMGVVFMLIIGFLTMGIADHLLPERDEWVRVLLRPVIYIGGLAYYPLVYWSLGGMETGLLTVLVLSAFLLTFAYARSGNRYMLLASAVFFGLAFLTRNDSILFFLLAWAYLALAVKDSDHRLKYTDLIGSAGLVLCTIAAELLFQYLYYGSVLPNTYTLKLTGMPLAFRLQNGLGFIMPFIRQTAPVWILALASLLFRYTREKLLLLGAFASVVCYQVYVGGDPWSYWRIMAPAMPLALALDMVGLATMADAIVRRLSSKTSAFIASNNFRTAFVFLFVTAPFSLALVLVNSPFFQQINLTVKPYHTPGNKTHVDTAIALNDLLDHDATIGVIWAGAIPYYTEFRAIDFLGKSDRYIASLPPDLSGSVSWEGMRSVPGHNKYDLWYSILTLRPTYVQSLAWGNQNVSAWAQTLYVTVQYKGLTLYLLRNSPDVHWNRLEMP